MVHLGRDAGSAVFLDHDRAVLVEHLARTVGQLLDHPFLDRGQQACDRPEAVGPVIVKAQLAGNRDVHGVPVLPVPSLLGGDVALGRPL